MSTVCIYCSHSEAISSPYLDLATDAGAELARRGHSLVCGGGTISCMRAALVAASAYGGRRVCIVSSGAQRRSFEDYYDELVVTHDAWAKRRELARRADGYLVLPGGLGTLEELFEVWSARLLGIASAPIAVVDAGEVFARLRTFVLYLEEKELVSPGSTRLIYWAESVADAFDYLQAHMR